MHNSASLKTLRRQRFRANDNPIYPVIPMTPPHSVLSRSKTQHLAERPCRAAIARTTMSPYAGDAGKAISCFAPNQDTGLNEPSSPSCTTLVSS